MNVPVISLGDVVTLKTGPFGSALHQSDYVDGGVPLINPTHICNGRLLPDHSVAVCPRKFAELSDFSLDVGDVVMGRRGEMGRCAVVTDAERGWLCGTGSIIVRPTPSISPKYLQRFLSSPTTVQALERDSVGTTMVNLNQKILLSLPLSLPSIDEQNRIAAILDKADALRAKRRETIVKLDQLLQSVFIDMFGDPTVVDERWSMALLPDVADVRYGFAFDSTQFGDAGGKKLVRIRDVLRGDTETRYLGREQIESRYLVETGDILIGMDGNFHVARWQGGEALLNQRVCKVVPDHRSVSESYLFACLPYFMRKLELSTPAVTVKHLSAKQLRGLRIPMPPRALQQRYEVAAQHISNLRERSICAEWKAERLFRGLQQKCFEAA